AEHAGLVAREELDALLGVLEVLGAAPGHHHAFLERLERVLEGKMARLERVHDLLEARQGVLKFDVAHRVPWSRSPERRACPRPGGSRSDRRASCPRPAVPPRPRAAGSGYSRARARPGAT